MPSVFITTTALATPSYPWAHSNYLRILKAAAISADPDYSLALEPGGADLILFVETCYEYQSDLLSSPLYRRFRSKSVVLDFRDNPRPVAPGLYVGLSRSQAQSKFFQGCAYIRVADNPLLQQCADCDTQPDLLFAFIGNVNNSAKIRSEILSLSHPSCLLINRSSNQSDSDPDYFAALARSKFILCPRGIGPSTWRLYETMRMGRVPVVISDEWVPPLGIDWESFVIRVSEADIHRIPSILSKHEHHWAQRAQRAYHEWQRCLSSHSLFSWICASSLSVLNFWKDEAYKPSLYRQLANVHSPRTALRLVRERINAFNI